MAPCTGSRGDRGVPEPTALHDMYGKERPTAASVSAREAALAGLVGRRTAVLVSHDTEKMQRLCDYVVDLELESDSAIPVFKSA